VEDNGHVAKGEEMRPRRKNVRVRREKIKWRDFIWEK